MKDNINYSNEYKKVYFDYCTTSQKLINQLSVLTNQLGLRTIFQYRAKINKWNSAYSIRLSTQYHNSKLKTKIEQQKIIHNKYVYDLEVGDTQTFVDAHGLVLLHNTDFGFRIAAAKYYSIMLPYPAMEHWGSQTFANNFELNITTPTDNICSMQEYREIMSKKYTPDRIEPIPGKVYRMDYSRVYFAKKWECADYYDCPQVEVHQKYIDILPKINVKYLDMNLQEKEHEC